MQYIMWLFFVYWSCCHVVETSSIEKATAHYRRQEYEEVNQWKSLMVPWKPLNGREENRDTHTICAGYTSMNLHKKPHRPRLQCKFTYAKCLCELPLPQWHNDRRWFTHTHNNYFTVRYAVQVHMRCNRPPYKCRKQYLVSTVFDTYTHSPTECDMRGVPCASWTGYADKYERLYHAIDENAANSISIHFSSFTSADM